MFGKKEKEKVQKYVVMSRIDGTVHYHAQKGFATREDADAYARLMMKTETYDKNKFYLFEQSQAYSLDEKNVVRTEESFSTNG
tara:strand:- start:314 stop:562 length:249 start_codon:yes stop_codon:yes gene_type:complete